MSTYRVYDGTDLILTVRDEPGPITSTAPPPPGGAVQHPFLSASAHSAVHEHRLRELLEASASVDDFLGRLRGAGFEVSRGR